MGGAFEDEPDAPECPECFNRVEHAQCRTGWKNSELAIPVVAWAVVNSPDSPLGTVRGLFMTRAEADAFAHRNQREYKVIKLVPA